MPPYIHPFELALFNLGDHLGGGYVEKVQAERCFGSCLHSSGTVSVSRVYNLAILIERRRLCEMPSSVIGRVQGL